MQSHFRVQAIQDWHRVFSGEQIGIDVPEGGRRVKFAVFANGPVEVWAITFKDAEKAKGKEAQDLAEETGAMLVGYGEGQFSTEFTVEDDALMCFLADDDTSIFIRDFAPDQRVAKTDPESYVSVMPMNRRNSDLHRLSMMMRLNSIAMTETLQAEREAMQAHFADQLAEAKLAAAAKGSATDDPAQLAGAPASAPVSSPGEAG